MKKEEALFTFYGAKPSKSGKGWNITLVEGKDETKHFRNAYVKAEKAREKDGVVWVAVKLLQDKKETLEELPF